MDLNKINAEYSHAANRVTDLYYGALEQIRNNTEMDGNARASEAWAAHAAAVKMLEGTTEKRNAALEEREQELNKRLYSGPKGLVNPEGAATYTHLLAQAAQADDATLERMSRAASKSGNTTLGRAVMVAASDRGRGDLVSAFLGSHPEDAEAHAELTAIPDAGARERALSNVPEAIPGPRHDQVMPRADAQTQPAPVRPLAG